MIYFTSDLHFHHKRILDFELESRPWKDVESMNKSLIEKWNETVKPTDEVWHLGDFSFAGFEKTKEILLQLNGKINFIIGNHDSVLVRYQDRFKELLKLDGNIMMNSIQYYHEMSIQLEEKVKQKIVLFHYPIEEWNRCQYGSIHLYGHVHSRGSKINGRNINVGWDYRKKFLSLDEVLNLAKNYPIINHH